MINLIIETFCRERGIDPSELDGHKRRCNVWITRYMIWHYLHYGLGLSANKLSTQFKRNRPSIFRGIRIIKHQFKYHKELCEEYHGIIKKIEGASIDTPPGNME